MFADRFKRTAIMATPLSLVKTWLTRLEAPSSAEINQPSPWFPKELVVPFENLVRLRKTPDQPVTTFRP